MESHITLDLEKRKISLGHCVGENNGREKENLREITKREK